MMSQRDPFGTFGLLLFAVLICAPLLYGFGYAVSYAFGGAGILERQWTTGPFISVLADAETWKALGFSIWISAASIFVSVSGALGATFVFHSGRRRGYVEKLLLVAVSVPSVVVALVVFQWFSGSGWFFRFFSSEQAVSFVEDRFGMGIILGHVAFGLPFLTLVFLALYDSSEMDRLLQVAASLGCRRRRALRQVAVPTLVSSARANLILLAIAFFGSYELPWLLGRQSPQMISVLTYRKYALFNLADKPEAFALAILYAALVGLILYLAFRTRNPGVYSYGRREGSL